MFDLMLILAYIIPSIYIFFRVKSLFISKGYRLWYIFIYLFIGILPMVARFGPRGTPMIIVLNYITGYLVPFFLYFFLSLILFELFLLFNMLFTIVSSERRKRFSFRLCTICAMIVLSIVVVIGGAINLNTIRVSKYSITVPRKQSKINHLKVAFVADFHIQRKINMNFVKQYVSKMNALQPDLLLYGGDIVEGHGENETTETVESALRSIHAKYGAFAVLGNHEFYSGQNHGNFFRKAGIYLLCDTLVSTDSSFYLAGRYDQHFRQRKPLHEILGSTSPDLPVILMDHRPTELQEVSHTVTDVQFSGHTHYGQMFPINLITNSVYELSWGYKKIRNTHFFVTSGLRLWGPPVKTAGKSEIMLVDIYFK